MKKVKLFLIAAAMLGIGSSFAFRAKDSGDIYVKVNGAFQLKSSQSGLCIYQNLSACNYVLKVGHSPNSDSDFDYNINDNEMWQPAP